MESIGTLAGGIAHDFNNLLMGIQGHTSLALLNIDSHDINYEHLKTIESLVMSGANLTKQLLGFARDGKYEVNVVDLNQLIQNNSETIVRTKKEISIHRNLEKKIKYNQLFLAPLAVIISIFTWIKGEKGKKKYWLDETNSWEILMGGNGLIITAKKTR